MPQAAVATATSGQPTGTAMTLTAAVTSAHHREFDDEPGPAARPVLDPHPAPVEAGVLRHQRQAEAGAVLGPGAARRLAPDEPFEDVVPLVLGDAGPPVLHGEADPPVGPGDTTRAVAPPAYLSAFSSRLASI